MDINQVCLHCFGYRGEYDVCPHCGYIAGTEPTEPYLLHPGTVLHQRYVIGTLLGTGGFGVTYRAWDAMLHVPVAIKEYYPAGLVTRIPGEAKVRLFSGEKQAEFAMQLGRFLEEARNLALFSSEAHVVHVLDFFEDNGTAYIIMEFLDGETLKEHMLSRGGKLPVEEAKAIAIAFLEGLASIHAKGIIHRDISPDNIFILRDGTVKILDFGAARLSENESADLTQSVVIKMGYAPPEQYRSNMPQGPWTDVYAAGATFYKMITSITPEESVDRMERDTLRRPGQLGANLPPEIEKTIMRALALSPQVRFQSVQSMLDALEGRTSIEYPEEEVRRRKRGRGFVIVLVLVLVLALGSAVGWYASRPEVFSLTRIVPERDTMSVGISSFFDQPETWKTSLEQVAEAFTLKYPELRVVVEVSSVEETRAYATTMGTSGPTLFLYSNASVPGPNAAHLLALTPLVSELDRSTSWGLPHWNDLVPTHNLLPTGMDVRVAYLNETAFAQAGVEMPERIESLQQLRDLAQSGCSIPSTDMDDESLLRVFSKEEDAQGQQLLDELTALEQVNSEKEIAVWIGWTQRLHSVQEEWQGRYRVVPVGRSSGMTGQLSDLWGINAVATENQQNAAMLFLHFLLSEYAQNTLYIQQGTTLPINRATFRQFIGIHQDLSFLTEAEMTRLDLPPVVGQ